MIEATCTACGTANIFSDVDLAPGAKYALCESCKAKVVLPSKATLVAAGLPGNVPGLGPIPSMPAKPGVLPRPSVPTSAGARPSVPAIPSIPSNASTVGASVGKPPPVPVRTPPGGGNAGDVIDLADLPAPKRMGGLAGAAPSRPAPASALASVPAADVAELPVPKRASGLAAAANGPSSPGIFDDLPAPKFAASSRQEHSVALDLDDLLAPVGAPIAAAGGGYGNLPAPKAAGASGVRYVDDLPAPKPKPAGGGFFDDLPAPRAAAARDVEDLLAPKVATAPGRYDDLPAPKAQLPSKAVSGASARPPARQAAAGSSEGADLLAPKSFFDDLPQPAVGGGKGSLDLPAPKGFFDDLPQPARNKGTTDLPAPKGFFDDLPQPARNQGSTDLPVPKGYFEDLPQLARDGGAGMNLEPTTSGRGRTDHASSDVAPKYPTTPQRPKPASMPGSLFDDIPLPPAAGGASMAGAAGRSSFGADLDGLDLAAPSASSPVGLGAPSAASQAGAPGAARASAPMLDLGESSPNLDIGDGNPNYGDLDLPMPSTVTSPAMAERAAIKFTPTSSSGGQGDRPPALDLSFGAGASGKDLSLDLEGESNQPRERAKPATKAVAKAKGSVADDDTPRANKKSASRTVKLIAAATLGVAAASAGGFFYYQRHSAAQQRAQTIADDLARARKLLAAGDPGHWGRAVSAAKKVLKFDSKNAEALGIVAEASFAGYLEEGTGGTARLAAGQRALGSASEAAVNSAALDRARALQALAGDQPDRALQALQTLRKTNPTDPTLALYIAWAQLELLQPSEAVQTLTAVVASPLRKAPGLYSRGQAYLELGDLVEARADFTGVLAIEKDHIGAQVGLAAAAPPTLASQREADVMSILQRTDIDQADVRAVVAAWTIAGDDARRAGRFDAARDRYRKALALAAADLAAYVGLAQTELQDDKIDLAAELVDKVLTLDANHVVGNVLAAEISLKRNQLDDANKKVAALMARVPPVTNPHQLARIQTLSGLLLEAQGRDADALVQFSDAIITAGDRDLSPTIATVKLLGKMAQKAQVANNLAQATALRARADQALAPLVSRAATESELTVIIGVSYLSAGDAVKAEEWLRKAVTTRPNDVEAYFQLAEALRRLQRDSESIEALRKAFDLDPTRTDVGVQLARTYEGLARNDDATQMYDKLLANKESSIELRSRAGRFFARLGQIEKAAAQGAEILTVDPENNAAGFYLRGEGELKAGRLDDARRSFVRAVELERDAQYLDAHGRASEQLAQKIGDTKYDEEALRAYSAASALAPTMYNPLAGQGRLYVKRHETVKALAPLLAANKLHPQDAEVMYGIGVSYQEQNQIKAAIAWLARSTTANATADSANRLGRLYLDTDQAGSAAMALTEAVRLGKEKEKALSIQVPWLTESLYFLGRVESDRRNVGGAKRAWEDFLGRNPPNPTQVDEVKRYLANPR